MVYRFFSVIALTWAQPTRWNFLDSAFSTTMGIGRGAVAGFFEECLGQFVHGESHGYARLGKVNSSTLSTQIFSFRPPVRPAMAKLPPEKEANPGTGR